MSRLGTVKEGLIAVNDGAISYVGDAVDAPKIKAENVIEERGKLAIPGLINCHTHLAMTLFRGLVEDVTLKTWLSEAIWPLEAKLRPEDVYAGSLLGCLEMIKSGVTCFADMYFYEHKVAALLQKAMSGDPSALSSRKILEMVTIRGAEALGLEEKVGSLGVGKRADIILVDLKKPNLTPLYGLCAGFVFSAHGCDVDSVVVDGEVVVMENREVKTLDEEVVIEETQDAAFSLLKR